LLENVNAYESSQLHHATVCGRTECKRDSPSNPFYHRNLRISQISSLNIYPAVFCFVLVDKVRQKTTWIRLSRDMTSVSSVRYARVKSTITDDNSDDNVSQLQAIDSEEEDDTLPPVKVHSHHESPNHMKAKRSSLQRISIVTTALLILCYFVLSIGLTFYQRWLLKVHRSASRKLCQIFNLTFPFSSSTSGLQISLLRRHLSFVCQIMLFHAFKDFLSHLHG
jgi:hypothetical protein